MRSTFLLFILCWTCQYKLSSQARQDPEMIQLEQLIKIINKKDDTLRVFNFWATWCRPCVKELPYFEEMNVRLASSKYRQYLISLDFTDQISSKLSPFIKKKKLHSEVLVLDAGDPNIWIDMIEPSWSGTIPASLVTHRGKRCFIENSFEDTESLLNFVQTCNP